MWKEKRKKIIKKEKVDSNFIRADSAHGKKTKRKKSKDNEERKRKKKKEK